MFLWVFLQFAPLLKRTITISYKIGSIAILFKLVDEVCMFRTTTTTTTTTCIYPILVSRGKRKEEKKQNIENKIMEDL